jgi:hypothetical protein
VRLPGLATPKAWIKFDVNQGIRRIYCNLPLLTPSDKRRYYGDQHVDFYNIALLIHDISMKGQ